MMKNFMTSRALPKGKKPEGDSDRKDTTPFPREEAVLSIYDRLVPHESGYPSVPSMVRVPVHF
jgi:hypothetical protein